MINDVSRRSLMFSVAKRSTEYAKMVTLTITTEQDTCTYIWFVRVRLVRSPVSIINSTGRQGDIILHASPSQRYPAKWCDIVSVHLSTSCSRCETEAVQHNVSSFYGASRKSLCVYRGSPSHTFCSFPDRNCRHLHWNFDGERFIWKLSCHYK